MSGNGFSELNGIGKNPQPQPNSVHADEIDAIMSRVDQALEQEEEHETLKRIRKERRRRAVLIGIKEKYKKSKRTYPFGCKGHGCYKETAMVVAYVTEECEYEVSENGKERLSKNWHELKEKRVVRIIPLKDFSKGSLL